MEFYTHLLIIITGFIILALASNQIGHFFTRFKLPLISGFLVAGILFGPYGLDFIHARDVGDLHFVDEVSLAFIAFAAGSELYLKELRSRFKSITWVTIGLVVVIFTLTTTAVFLLASYVPFMRDMPNTLRLAVALLAGAILVARSPSSAIAIVNEIRARGPLTQTVMGVTIISDVLVIVIFGLNLEIAEALLTDVSFNLGFALLLLFELLFAMGMGIILAYILKLILTLHMDGRIKIILILATGYAIFALSTLLHDNSHDYLNITLTLEPLLVCMIAGFWVTNRTNYRAEFLKLLEEVAPIVYIIFFTLTGASLALDVLAATWHIALALFAVRLLGIFIGAFSGGVIARDPMKFNRVSWLTYVTMAGVSLGLAKEVADKFPTWGPELATIIIAVIVLNQIVGPPMFKWALNRVGEAHPRHEKSAFDGVRDAIIFGIDGQAVALSRQLVAHGWQVKTACLDTQLLGTGTAVSDLHIHPINNFSIDTLRALNAENADAIVTLLSDDENYQICETAYEHLGTEILVVRLNNRANFDRFHRLGALIVDPATVMVGLLDHFVRSPSAASLLLGMDEGQDVVDVEVRNKDLHGITLRELRLPLDTLIMSVQRDGHAIISHGYTELHYGDRITVVGSVDSLEEIFLRFDEQI